MTYKLPPLAELPNTFRGTNLLLQGASGTGKTYAIHSLVNAGITPFVLFTEPGMEILEDIPEDKCHWKYIPPVAEGFDAMMETATKIRDLSFEGLTKLKAGIDKKGHDQWLDVLTSLGNFRCDRTGEEFGSVLDWKADRALVVDSLSGLCIMSMALVIGGKPVKSMSDWMVAQDNVEKLINKLCMDTACWFVLTAHIDRLLDEVMGGMKVMTSSLGSKLSPKLPRYFSDVVLCSREGDKFLWDTADSTADLKARNLPVKGDLPPDFSRIVQTALRS